MHVVMVLGTEIFLRIPHNAIQEIIELPPFYWLGEIFCQHVISRKLFNCDFPAVNSVLNVGVPDVYVIYTDGT